MMLAALARDDKSDLQRLVSSAPQKSWQFNDYYFDMKALHEVALIHQCHQLELVAKLLKAMWYRAETSGHGMKQDALASKAILKLRREMAWEHLAWMSVCKELNIDTDAIFSPLFEISIAKEELAISLELFCEETCSTGNEERDAYIQETAEAYKSLMFRDRA
ncbi:MAG TPA: hypothetical protein PLN21_06625 [Gemmatales bacterium]|nr:hypothetical protein [Gemmatales bacterium]